MPLCLRIFARPFGRSERPRRLATVHWTVLGNIPQTVHGAILEALPGETLLKAVRAVGAALALLVLSLLASPAQAAGDKRVALVIGNGAYTVAPALENPTVDAKAVAAALKRLNFEVIEGYDLTYAGMRQTIGRFASAMEDSRAAVVYYAGHGVSVDDENFLLPTDISLKNASDLDLNAVSLSLILRQMKREERVNVVILDACRDNPFARELATGRGRSLAAERGLSRVDVDLAKGTMIAFATDPKSTALDGRAGENSPFTRALLHHIETPGASIDTIMNRVRSEVWSETRNKQMPWVNTSIIGEFVLNPGAPSASASASAVVASTVSDAAPPASASASPGGLSSASPDRVALDVRFWESAERGGSVDDYRAYLSAWPNGLYTEMAKARVAKLSASSPASASLGAGPSSAKLAEAAAAQHVAALPTEAKRESGGEAIQAQGVPPQVPGVAPQAPAGVAPQSAPAAAAPVAPLDAATRAEVGTVKTEADLKLAKAARADVQARLAALGRDPGARNGTLTQSTREALAAWQAERGVAATGWLAPLTLAALKAESEPKLAPFLKAESEKAREARRSVRAKAAAEAPRKAAPRAAAVEPRRRVAAPRRAVRRAVSGDYVDGYEPPPHHGPMRGGPPGGGFNPAIGGFLGGVAAGAILNGAFRR